MKNLIIILLLFVTVSSYAQNNGTLNTIKVGGIDTAAMLGPYKNAYPRQAVTLNFTTTGTSGASTMTYNSTTGVLTVNIPQYAGSGTNWSLLGNGSTDSSINFIGTTDTKPLVIKINSGLMGKFSTNGNFSFGPDAVISAGVQSIAMGSVGTRVYSNYSNVIGTGVVAKGDVTTVLGNGLLANNYGSTVMGNWNDTALTITTSFYQDSRTHDLWCLGMGNNSSNRQNAISVLQNGNTGIGVRNPAATLDISGTLKLGITGSVNTNWVLTNTGSGVAEWKVSSSSGGTVTNVAALTLGTSGSDLSSTVANPTTTPVITLNVPTASASNRGALSSTDWSTFNGKQAAGNFFTRTGDSASYINLPNQTILTPIPTSGVTMFDSSGRWSYRNILGKTVSFSTSLISANSGVIDTFQNKSGVFAYLSDTSTFQSKFGADTGRANIYPLLAGKLSAGSITWPGTIYTTPTTGTVSSGTLTFAPALASQSPYTVLGRASGSGVPSFLTLDSNYLTGMHTQSYYDLRYGIPFPNTTNKYNNGYGNFPALQMDSITNGTTNMYEVSQSTAPTVASGRLWNNTSFPSPPNSNSAFTWNPGLFYSTNGSTYAPLNGENSNSNSKYWGDSWTSNFGLSGAPNGFVNKSSYYRGLVPVNAGLSGATMLTLSSFLAASNDNMFLECGVNEMRLYGYPALQDYLGAVRNFAVYKQSGTISSGTSGTKTTPADWVADSILFNFTTATRTTVNASPITYTIAGNSVYVSIAHMSSTDVAYSVTIDGNSKGTFSSLTRGYLPSGTDPNSNATFYCHRFTGLGDSLHTVVLQKTSGTGQFRVIYVASNYKPTLPFGNNNNRTSVLTIGKMTTGTAAVSGYNLWGGSDTLTNTYNTALGNVIYQLANDGLNVNLININKYYNPKTSGYVQSDSLHPADAGHTAIARGIIENTSLTILPREREIIRFMRDFITTDSTGNANIGSPSGNVGIGTTSPTSIFSVGSSSQFQTNSSGNIVKLNNVTTSFPSSQGAANTRLTNDGSGNLSWGNILSMVHNISTPTTGGTVNLTTNNYNIINPAGALVALTVNLPSSPANNDVVYIKYTQSITTVTYGNGTVVDGITSPVGGGLVILVYDSGTTSWY